MSNYRLYTLDSNDKIVSAFDHDCADDRTAIALVREVWAGGQRAEIWRGATRLRPSTSLDNKDLKPTTDVLPSPERSQRKEATYG